MTPTPLEERLIRTIKTSGPITVAEYMSTCLGDPEHGYYITRPPFGQEGDFTTAPEISQMFGELIGVFCLNAYERMGKPESFCLIELGPGRGTLMADVLRVTLRDPEFAQAVDLWLVETSPRLQEIQCATLSQSGVSPSFADHIDLVPPAPAIVLANEFLDALPIHQFVKTETGWHERMVGLDANNHLSFGLGQNKLQDIHLTAQLNAAPQGSILETQPAANAIVQSIAGRLKSHHGTALFIDYGYLETATGDSFQAIKNHQHVNVLETPGEADLTAHVNFAAIANATHQAGAVSFPPLTQGEFLLRLGLLERAGMLGAGKKHSEQEAIRDDVERLAAPQQMGDLFKVVAVSDISDPLFPFDEINTGTGK